MNLLSVLKKGKYVNLWTANHFLSGVVFAGWVFNFSFDFWQVFISYLFLAIAWEVLEFYLGEFELLGNKIMDVVTGVLGLLLVYYFLVLQEVMSQTLLVFCTILFVILEIYLFIDYRKRKLNPR